MNRLQAINKIKKAYETKQLGFQKGARNCLYYDQASDSCCAVGVLLRKDKALINKNNGNRFAVFRKGLDADSYTIGSQMEAVGKDVFHGLTIDELRQLQNKHDGALRSAGSTNSDKTEKRFKDYLYSLEA